MKKWLASTVAIVALIVFPIDTGNAYPGGGHGGGGGGGHSSGGGGNHSSGGGNHSSGGGNHSGNNSSAIGNNSIGNGNSSGSRHSSNSNGHPNAKNHTNNSSHTNSSNNSGHNHTNNSNGHNNHNSNHFHYTHQHGHSWDSKEWNHAWYRHWYHDHFIFWNGGWVWWDPDVSEYVPYVEGQYIPEDYYVQGQDPPAGGGGAILVVNPTDTQTTINYSINDNDYQIAPGSQQELSADQQWVISFDRGDNDGNAEYTLAPGVYTFGPSDHGWELYHTSDSVDN
jgi:hypothetical protein